MPLVLVSRSEKWGAVGTFTDISSIGKFSARGIPPPREMRPGFLRWTAACLRAEGCLDLLSTLRRSGMG